jgi:DNA-directed RNA polymerase subunit RPC12/RpoP
MAKSDYPCPKCGRALHLGTLHFMPPARRDDGLRCPYCKQRITFPLHAQLAAWVVLLAIGAIFLFALSHIEELCFGYCERLVFGNRWLGTTVIAILTISVIVLAGWAQCRTCRAFGQLVASKRK